MSRPVQWLSRSLDLFRECPGLVQEDAFFLKKSFLFNHALILVFLEKKKPQKRCIERCLTYSSLSPRRKSGVHALEKVFWDDFLGNSLPKSINMLISFVVMMNFGYFTLMFYIKVLGITYFVT